MENNRINIMKSAITTLIDRTDNLFRIEEETNVSIEVLEKLKEGRMTVEDLDAASATDLYYLSIQWGHVELNQENKYRYLKKINYGTLPLHFPISAYSVVLYVDREQYLSEAKKVLVPSAKYDNRSDVNDVEIKRNVIKFLKESDKVSGALMIFKNGDVYDLEHYGLVLTCGQANESTEDAFEFIRGITDIPHSQIIKNLLEAKIFTYYFLTDTIRIFSSTQKERGSKLKKLPSSA